MITNKELMEKYGILTEENNIPKDVNLESDSGWECDPTDINGVLYSPSENRLVFAQDGYFNHERYPEAEWDFWEFKHS